MRNLRLLLLGVFVLAAIAFALLRTPNSDANAMQLKYGGPDARFVETGNGLRVHYRDEGRSQATTVLFIHGSSSSLNTWEPLIDRLPNYFRLISLDLPGHGLTGPHPDNDYRANAMAAAVNAVMDEVGVNRAIVVGSSMGGWVAWRMALSHPERVQALVLANASGAPVDEPSAGLPYAPLTKYAPGRWMLSQITPRSLVEDAVRVNFSDLSLIDDVMIDRYWELLRYPGNRRATMDRMQTDREPEMWQQIGNIDVPVLLVWGEEDQVVPVAQAHKFAAALPGSKLHVYPDVGHLPMEEVPEEMSQRLVRFVIEVLASESSSNPSIIIKEERATR